LLRRPEARQAGVRHGVRADLDQSALGEAAKLSRRHRLGLAVAGAAPGPELREQVFPLGPGEGSQRLAELAVQRAAVAACRPGTRPVSDRQLEVGRERRRLEADPLELVPPEPRRGADVAADDEDRRGNAEALEQRLADEEVVDVAVVEGDRDGAAWEATRAEAADDRRQRHRLEALADRLEV